jgi:excisionase family DNA binding protein
MGRMTDLLTTRQVQGLLQVDRTTIYRMVESGQLPAVRVGKQWRFPSGEIERWLAAQGRQPTAASSREIPATPRVAEVSSSPAGHLSELLPMACSQMVQDTFAEALGVMLMITDMDGRPVTKVSNPCGLYAVAMESPEALSECIRDWQSKADAAPIEPRYAVSALGTLCARGLIRAGNELKGMLVVGGIAPEVWPPEESAVAAIAEHFGMHPARLAAHVDEVYRLDAEALERTLPLVQRIADIYSHMIEDRRFLSSRLRAIASLTAF